MKVFTFQEGPGNPAAIDVWTSIHFLFGFVWYFAFSTVMDVHLSFIISVCVHIVFEIGENMPWGVWLGNKMTGYIKSKARRQKYLPSTYTGDSAVNSVVDIAAGIAGFWIGYAIWRPKKGKGKNKEKNKKCEDNKCKDACNGECVCR